MAVSTAMDIPISRWNIHRRQGIRWRNGFMTGRCGRNCLCRGKLELAAYGSAERGPLAALDDGTAAIPPVGSGYSWFRDRHRESEDPADPAGLFDRYSYNFDLAVYDTDTDTLYYVALDT